VRAFISHSSADAALAKRVATSLRRGRLEAWLDSRDISVGSLLRDELQTEIKRSDAVVLLWSEAASRSRWVAAEIFTAFHLGRFIIACEVDATPPPYFLANTVRVDLRRDEAERLKTLRRAVREAPRAANGLQPFPAVQAPKLLQAITAVNAGQHLEMQLLVEGRTKEARQAHARVDKSMRELERSWPLDATVLNLAGYHRKNEYMLNHLAEIDAGRPPEDPLLERAERFFFDTLFVNPTDYSALNGLGSVLIFGREYDAAEFFIRRAIHYAELEGITYDDALQDLAQARRLKREQRGD
jgi:hypothetical protein